MFPSAYDSVSRSAKARAISIARSYCSHASARMPPAMIERPGATTVGAHTLHEIVRKLPDGATVSLEDDGTSGRLEITAGRSHFSLATLPKEDFPVMASSEYDTNFTAKSDARLDRYGHSYFRDAPTVSSDLVLMLRDDLDAGPPGRPLEPLGFQFWRIPPGYPDDNSAQ